MTEPDHQSGKKDATRNLTAVGTSTNSQFKSVSGVIEEKEHSESVSEGNLNQQTASETQKETLNAIRKGERLTLGIAAIVAIATVGQWITTSCNNTSTSKQTGQLIEAAKVSAASAHDSAAAARSFAQSADLINKGVSDAVAKLGVQAAQTERLAEVSKDSLHQGSKQFVSDERPYLWVNDDRPPVTFVQGPSVADTGKLATNFWFKNFGKSPAVNVLSYGYISANSDDPVNDIHWEQFPHKGVGVYAPNGIFVKTAYSSYAGDFSNVMIDRPFDHNYKPRYAIHFLIKYEDLVGNKYESEICMILQPNNFIVKCSKHNHIK